jgi:hypothetical protein
VGFRVGQLDRHLDAPMNVDHEQVCREISGELQDMARWLSGGGLSPEQYRLGLTRLEDQRLRHLGLKLSSLVSENGVVHFSMHFADNEELCVSIDVDPMTGKMTTQPACQSTSAKIRVREDWARNLKFPFPAGGWPATCDG